MSHTKPLYPIQTHMAPSAIGPYSQAIVANDLIYCSGQIGIDPETGLLAEGVENQTRRIMASLSHVLLAAHSDLEHVIKTTIYLKDMKTYATVNEIYASFFAHHKPARSTVEVSRLPKDADIEIDLIAIKK